MANSDQMFRIERDAFGERTVPAGAYYGIQTLRAAELFPITGAALRLCPDLIAGLAAVKQAAASTSSDLGLLERTRAAAIAAACKEIRLGAMHDQFPIDLIGGAAASCNANIDEVAANRALELLGRRRGDYEFLDPDDHVSLGQRAEDVYATAVRVAVIEAMRRLGAAMAALRGSFEAKAQEWESVIEMSPAPFGSGPPGCGPWGAGAPIVLGHEFAAFGRLLADDEVKLVEAELPIRSISLGAHSGCGSAARLGYPDLLRERLSAITDIPFSLADDLATARGGRALVQLSGVLRGVALKLSYVCDDLRRVASGSYAGGRLSGGAPGGVPGGAPGGASVPDIVSQIACEVIGNDVTIACAVNGRHPDSRTLEPVIVFSLLRSLGHLLGGCRLLDRGCVRGLGADRRDMLTDLHRYATEP